MLYILNQTLLTSKRIIYALTDFYGINLNQSKKLCKILGINPNISIEKLNYSKINNIENYILKNLLIGIDLKKKIIQNYKDLLEIKNLRGINHTLGLPVNGQRTHTNAKTARKFKNQWIKQKF